MIQKLKKKVEQSATPSINNESITHFNQLISYIDSSIIDAFSKEGNEKSKTLLSHVLVIRDYLTKIIGSNGLRQSLMSEVLATINTLEVEESNKNSFQEVSSLDAESVEDVSKKKEATYSIETS